MIGPKDFSIKDKIIGIILVAVLMAIGVGFVTVATISIRTLRQEMVNNVLLNATLIGEHCIVPMTFENDKAIQKVLQPLHLIPFAENGCVYDTLGRPMAVYNRGGEIAEPPDLKSGSRWYFKDKFLHVIQPIVHNDIELGKIYLRASTRSLYYKINTYFITMIGIALGLIVFSYIIAVKLQSIISKPILDLAAITRDISREGDYSIRVTQQRSDEIGELYSGFNNMLAQINSRESERDIAEIALHKSERKFRAILAQTFQFIGLMEVDGTIIEASQAAMEAVGVKEEEFLGKLFWETVMWTHSPELQDKLQKAVKKAAKGETVRFEANHISSTGETIYVDFSLKPIKDDDGNVVNLIPEGYDITERKIAERATRESEKKYRELTENLPQRIFHKNTKLEYVYCNKLYAKDLGIEPYEIIGKTDFDLYPRELAEKYQSDDKRIMKQGQTEEIEESFIQNDQKLFAQTLKTPLTNDSGITTGILGMFWDITERKLAERKMLESEERYRSLYNSMVEAVCQNEVVYDDSGKAINVRVIDVNPQYEKLFQLKKDDVIGKLASDIGNYDFLNEDIYRFDSLVKVAETGVPTQFQIYHSPMEKHLLVSAFSPQKGQFAVIFEDITERKRAEDALEKRIVALTRPLQDTISNVNFEDLFNLKDIQRLQDEFAKASCVASIITHIDGTPITEPSNFCRLCIEIRKTDIGLAKCIRSDAMIGRYHPEGPIIQPCISCGLWDAGAAISIGGKHIANWLIGQVRNDAQNEEKMRAYAKEIGADENSFIEAFEEVPSMSREQFGKVAQALFTLANQLSTSAFQNVQQARFISDRKMAEEALRNSEERFRDLAEMLPQAVVETDININLTYANKCTLELFGYTKEDLKRGVDGITLIAPQDRDRAKVNVSKRLEGDDPGIIEYQALKKDGTNFPVLFHANLIKKNSNTIGIRGIFVDITETKRLQNLESRAARLETAGTIAGQVAHDFNNLLAPMMAYPEMIRDILPPDHDALEYIDDIENAAQKIAEINQDLLTLGRRGHYNLKVLDLNKVVAQAVRGLESNIETVDYEMNLCEDLMKIKGGNAQIHRMLINLFVNAQDAMNNNGQITIKTENYYADDTSFAYGYVPIGEYTKLTISDTGCGIPDEIIQNILDPFFSTKTTDKERGSGLGLSVVDAVMKDHQGYLDLSSVVGRGTSFYLYFPITRETFNNNESGELVGGTEMLLVVDDDHIQRNVSMQLLTNLGYDVNSVDSGEKAIEFIKEKPQDLVILDMVMPGKIDGTETYRRILEYNPSQKAIILSGFSETDRVIEAQKLGAGAFVRKPVTKSIIAAAVRTELDRVSKRVLSPSLEKETV